MSVKIDMMPLGWWLDWWLIVLAFERVYVAVMTAHRRIMRFW